MGYTVTAKDLNYCMEQLNRADQTGRSRVKFIVKNQDDIERLAKFFKITNQPIKKQLESFEKYETTQYVCRCVYNQHSSMEDFGFHICKHTYQMWLQDFPMDQSLRSPLQHLTSLGKFVDSLKQKSTILNLVESFYRLRND